MKHVTAAAAAQALGISAVRLRQLLLEGRVQGAEKIGRDWIIPVRADGRPRVEEKETTRGPRATWAAAEHAPGYRTRRRANKKK